MQLVLTKGDYRQWEDFVRDLIGGVDRVENRGA